MSGKLSITINVRGVFVGLANALAMRLRVGVTGRQHEDVCLALLALGRAHGLLERSDIVSLSVPLGTEVHGLDELVELAQQLTDQLIDQPPRPPH
jgi:hypothetical protein